MEQPSIAAVLSAVCTAACVTATPSDPAADRQAVAAVSARFGEAEKDGAWKQARVIWNSSDPPPSGGV